MAQRSAVNSVGESEASDEVTATPTAANTAPVIGTADAAVDYAENTPVDWMARPNTPWPA